MRDGGSLIIDSIFKFSSFKKLVKPIKEKFDKCSGGVKDDHGIPNHFDNK
jgi:hypothetical protein